jgi:hypothetical protein
MDRQTKQDELRALVDDYIRRRRYPFKSPWASFYNWINRIVGRKYAFSVIRNHDLTNSLKEQEKISAFIKSNKLSKNQIKDFMVYLKNHNIRLSDRGYFAIGFASLTTATVVVYQLGLEEPSIDILIIFGMLSVGMISERIQLHRYKSLYEELYNFIEREIEKMP